MLILSNQLRSAHVEMEIKQLLNQLSKSFVHINGCYDNGSSFLSVDDVICSQMKYHVDRRNDVIELCRTT